MTADAPRDSPQNWPHGVEPIGLDDLRRLGITSDNQLFWDGRRVEVRRRLTLTGLQKTIAAVVTVCAILGGLGSFFSGLNNASLFLCARGIHVLGCSATPPIPPQGSEMNWG